MAQKYFLKILTNYVRPAPQDLADWLARTIHQANFLSKVYDMIDDTRPAAILGI